MWEKKAQIDRKIVEDQSRRGREGRRRMKRDSDLIKSHQGKIQG